ncbi:MAG: 50S ribosomal protein L29 [Patescibacteria group bacterium]
MDWSELEQKSPTELQRLLQEKRELLRDRRFKVALGQHQDVRELRELKRDIARVLTKLQTRTASPPTT